MASKQARERVQLAVALFAEFFGLLFFQLFGGAAGKGVYNGLLLMVLIYCTAELSGGVLNPAVALALMVGGELPWMKGVLYIIAEMMGAIFGSIILWGLDPSFNHHRHGIGNQMANAINATLMGEIIADTRTGCVDPGPDARNAQIFGCEFLGTALLVATVFATAVSKKGFGNLAPLAIGYSIYVGVGATASLGGMGGGAFNPARFFGPAVALGCSFHVMWIYWLGEFGAGAVCGVIWRFTHTPWFLDHMKPVEEDYEETTEGKTPAASI